MRSMILGTGAFVLLFLLALPALSGNAEQPPIKIQSELLVFHGHDEAGHAATIRRLVVLLINTGNQPVTVVTEGLDQGTDEIGDVRTFTVGLNSTVEKDGHLIVPSLSKLAPVTLLPGEAASVSTDPHMPELEREKLLDELQSGKLSVSYEVSPFWGKRLSIWSGTVTSKITVK